MREVISAEGGTRTEVHQINGWVAFQCGGATLGMISQSILCPGGKNQEGCRIIRDRGRY